MCCNLEFLSDPEVSDGAVVCFLVAWIKLGDFGADEIWCVLSVKEREISVTLPCVLVDVGLVCVVINFFRVSWAFGAVGAALIISVSPSVHETAFSLDNNSVICVIHSLVLVFPLLDRVNGRCEHCIEAICCRSSVPCVVFPQASMIFPEEV